MEIITWIALLVIIGLLLNMNRERTRKLSEMHSYMIYKLGEMTEYQNQLGRMLREDVRMHIYLLNEERERTGKQPISRMN